LGANSDGDGCAASVEVVDGSASWLSFSRAIESHKYILTNLSALRDCESKFLFVHKCIIKHRQRVSENWTEEGGGNRRMEKIA
jgi:hypothetical protein